MNAVTQSDTMAAWAQNRYGGPETVGLGAGARPRRSPGRC